MTPFVRGALAAARARSAATVLVTCAPRPGLRAMADVVIAIPTGPEVLTGSTRLKAGSATKAVLNAITTAAMVRLGKAYENLMVDLKRNVGQAGGPRAPHRRGSRARASRARRIACSAAAGGEAKTAIVMGLLSLSPAQARRRLARAGGHVHRAVRERRR